jgi:hypothetical protein
MLYISVCTRSQPPPHPYVQGVPITCYLALVIVNPPAACALMKGATAADTGVVDLVGAALLLCAM